jgi:putative PIN family toxin of toxin-antitoxin system
LAELSLRFPGVSGGLFLELLTRYGELVEPGPVTGIFCRDPGDVKFIACLRQSKADCLVTGDKDLLDADLKEGLVLTPRQFCDRYL